MSRFLSALLALTFLFSLSACGKNGAEPPAETPAVEESVVPEVEPEPEPTPEELAAEAVEAILADMTLE